MPQAIIVVGAIVCVCVCAVKYRSSGGSVILSLSFPFECGVCGVSESQFSPSLSFMFECTQCSTVKLEDVSLEHDRGGGGGYVSECPHSV